MVKRLLLAVPLALLGAAWFYWLAMPWPVLLRWRDPHSTAVMRQREAEARSNDTELDIRYEWVPLDRISSRLQRAVIVAEDGRFTEHDGIDWLALREEFRYRGDDDFSWFDTDDVGHLIGSLNYYRQNREKVRGRSTITQQLTKNLYYSTDRSVVRKLEEFVVARRLERMLSKDRILELYLNTAEWGPGIFGVEAAAQHYFGVSADDLTRTQAASLAATLPHPLTSNPDLRPGRMAWRRDMILRRMGGSGVAETVPLAPPGEDPVTADPDSIDAPIGEPAAVDSSAARDTAATAVPDSIRSPAVPDTARRVVPPDSVR